MMASKIAMHAPDRPRKHFSMIREFHLADFFTLANAACGVATIFFALAYVDSGERALFFAAANDRLGQNLYWGAWELGLSVLHPLALLYVLSGTLMISKTLRIPKL